MGSAQQHLIAASQGLLLRAGKEELVYNLLSAKKASGKTFTQIAKEVGLTNLYTAQLFHNQASRQTCCASEIQHTISEVISSSEQV